MKACSAPSQPNYRLYPAADFGGFKALRVKRLGRVFTADDGPPWMVSHAAYPTPLLLGTDRLRLFFNSRDEHNRGSAGWADLDPMNPRRVLRVSPKPCLGPGSLGSFDDRGISNGSIMRFGEELRFYYLGWNKSADVPFRNAIGLATCVDGAGDLFVRPFEGPIIDRSRHDPYTLSYPFVEPGDLRQPWRMYYGTSRNGGDRETDMRHTLTEATSPDGINWSPTGQNIIELTATEYGLSRPWRFDFSGHRYLLFSIRRQKYTIGLAIWDPISLAWQRTTDDLLGQSVEDWDLDAACYASVASVGDQHYLFYCGRDYGRTGVGVAIIED